MMSTGSRRHGGTAGLVAGVDGGKSKTVCLVARRDGRVIGWGRSGNSDSSAIPMPMALDAIEAAVDRAAASADVTRADLDSVCFGLAGAVWPEDRGLLQPALEARGLGRTVRVVNDAQIALCASLIHGPGVVLSAGTHCSVAVRSLDGEEWYSGWSSVDGPGGAEAGRRVLRAVLREYDGRGGMTALTAAVLERTGHRPMDLLRAIARGDVDEAFTARLAPVLLEVHATTGDAVAAEIIRDLAHEMAAWVTGLHRRFHLGTGPFDVYLTGGLLRTAGGYLWEAIASAIHARTPRARVQPARREPVCGAIFEALAQTGTALEPDTIRRVDETAPAPDFFDTASTPDPQMAPLEDP